MVHELWVRILPAPAKRITNKFEKKAALMAYIKLGQKIDNNKFFSFNS